MKAKRPNWVLLLFQPVLKGTNVGQPNFFPPSMVIANRYFKPGENAGKNPGLYLQSRHFYTFFYRPYGLFRYPYAVGRSFSVVGKSFSMVGRSFYMVGTSFLLVGK